MTRTEPVTAIVPIMSPNRQHFKRTLAGLAKLEPTVDELVIIDSTPGGFRVSDGDCGLCGVGGALATLQETGATVRVIEEEMPRGEARNTGMKRASNDIVWHLDEDAVFRRPDALSRALDRLQADGVAAVGGPVRPIRGNVDGKAFAQLERMAPSTLTVHHLIHSRTFCTGEACFFAGQGRGEDLTLRGHLRQHGAIESAPEMEAEKDLPTLRQRLVRDLAGAVIGGTTAVVATRIVETGFRTAREAIS